MAYIGKGLNDIATANVSVDTMTGDGSDTTLALSMGTKGIGSVNDVSVFISGIQQRPNIDYTLSAGVITFTTAPVNGQAVCAISHSDSWQDNVADSSVVTESFADLAITDAKIIGLNSSKLTGAMPAISGASLTGITETTNSASDPAIDTNGTLGDIWVNTASGEMFILTDATTDENVWTNVGGGEGDVPLVLTFQGEISSYTHGGQQAGATGYNTIDKFSLTSQANATDVGDMTAQLWYTCGASSGTHGFAFGGDGQQQPANGNVINKYSHSSDGNAVDHGDLAVTNGAQRSSNSDLNAQFGYSVCGRGNGSPQTTQIDKVSFASNTTATDVGDSTTARKQPSGTSSTTHGYTAGGSINSDSSGTNVIDRFSFASNGNSVDVGDLTLARMCPAGSSSTTHGYTAGAYAFPTFSNVIDKFQFAATANATDVGDLTAGIQGNSGSSSTTHGYSMGGQPPATLNRIEQFSFSTDGNATDWADLSLARVYPGTSQI